MQQLDGRTVGELYRVGVVPFVHHRGCLARRWWVLPRASYKCTRCPARLHVGTPFDGLWHRRSRVPIAERTCLQVRILVSQRFLPRASHDHSQAQNDVVVSIQGVGGCHHWRTPPSRLGPRRPRHPRLLPRARRRAGRGVGRIRHTSRYTNGAIGGALR
jgi:hypothetical protein